jgi:pimeloyl-ACP methyl ester carboxylesterase
MSRDPAVLYRSSQGHQAVMASYQYDLRQITVDCRSLELQTRFGATHVLTAGPEEGQPVVLLHGWNTNAAGWWPQINSLAGSFRLYAPDTIGQAGRSSPTRPPLKGPGLAQWLVDVVDSLQLDCPDFIGSSGGAWLIVKLASLVPERIRSAVLISPAGFVPLPLSLLLRFAAIGMLRPGPGTARRYLRIMGNPVADEAHQARHNSLLLHFKSQLPPPTFRDAELRRLQAPTHLLIGEFDRAFRAAKVIERACHLLPDLRSAELVPGAGHDLTHSHAELVNDRLFTLLRGPSDSSPRPTLAPDPACFG